MVGPGLGSTDQALDDIPVHVGQPEVAALEAIGQPRVVKAHEVQDRGLEIVDVHPVVDGVVSQVVGCAVA